jgi:intracellular sulfur oxidation DsrE/DsrF family protein
MKQVFDLAKITAGQHEPVPLFAVTCLGIIESLVAGSLTPTQAIHVFFHGKNIRFVKSKLADDRASEIMGRGVQLGDLFDAMSMEEAHREFQHELQAMKSLCYELLEVERAAA